MFGLFRKSQEEVAAELFVAADEFDRKMVKTNFLQLAPGSLASTRFEVSAHMFAYLMCQCMVVNSSGKDPRRALEIARLVTEKCISDLANGKPMPLSDLIVCREEIEELRTLNKAQNDLPLDEQVRGIYVTRLSRMMRDDMQGLCDYLQQGPASLAQHIPRTRSLIRQTTDDEKIASDEQAVVSFVISYQLDWLSFSVKAQEALK